ncbi:hypothetical protein ACRRTK_021018 [Alexandromys fortis]
MHFFFHFLLKYFRNINFSEQISPKLKLLDLKCFVLAGLFIFLSALNVISGRLYRGRLLPGCVVNAGADCGCQLLYK